MRGLCGGGAGFCSRWRGGGRQHRALAGFDVPIAAGGAAAAAAAGGADRGGGRGAQAAYCQGDGGLLSRRPPCRALLPCLLPSPALALRAAPIAHVRQARWQQSTAAICGRRQGMHRGWPPRTASAAQGRPLTGPLPAIAHCLHCFSTLPAGPRFSLRPPIDMDASQQQLEQRRGHVPASLGREQAEREMGGLGRGFGRGRDSFPGAAGGAAAAALGTAPRPPACARQGRRGARMAAAAL